ncbi:MAG: cupin domain-containing protein [Oligoflexales bacterium]|nr:cupin domain-containing protein [Oligoflexales bacterium]
MINDAENCRSHPDDAMLERVSLGKADITETLIVEAHIHYCMRCYKRYFQLQQNLQNEFQSLGSAETVSPLLIDDDPILGALNDKLDIEVSKSVPSSTDPLQQILPPTVVDSLETLAGLRWNSFWPSKGKVSLLAEDRVGRYQLFLGIIDPGATLPGHKHSLNEQTLVLKGRYIAGGQTFEAGEWSETRPGDEHSPSAGLDEHCYCLIRAHKQGFEFTGPSRWRNVLVNMFTYPCGAPPPSIVEIIKSQC